MIALHLSRQAMALAERMAAVEVIVGKILARNARMWK